MPTRRTEVALWQHPSRLPLGTGWEGRCFAPGHENCEVPQDGLHSCNLGYAATCSWFPPDRTCDAVRFGITGDESPQIRVLFVLEKEHLPVQHGSLQFDLTVGSCASPHPDPRIQKMAECYLESYRLRNRQNSTSSSSNE